MPKLPAAAAERPAACAAVAAKVVDAVDLIVVAESVAVCIALVVAKSAAAACTALAAACAVRARPGKRASTVQTMPMFSSDWTNLSAPADSEHSMRSPVGR